MTRRKPVLRGIVVAVMGEHEVHAAIREEPDWGLVSIRDAGRPPSNVETRGPRLDLAFDDVPRSMPGWGYEPPRLAHALAILSFAKDLRKQRVPGLIVHCAAGVSRSTAAVIGIALAAGEEKSVENAVQALQAAVELAVDRGWRDNWSVVPNRRLVALFDHVLGLRGEPTRKVISMYKGSYSSVASVDSMVEESLLDAFEDP